MVEKKNWCVRIHYANDCHVDVVPYLVLGFFENRKVIVNHDTATRGDAGPRRPRTSRSTTDGTNGDTRTSAARYTRLPRR